MWRRVLNGLMLGVFIGAITTAVTWAVVKPGPCSEASICIRMPGGGCRPGPCELLDYHVPLLIIVFLLSVAIGLSITVWRKR
jgi:hypothetical protein